MAFLYVNDIFGFSPRPTSNFSEIPRRFHLKPNSLRKISPKTLNPTTRLLLKVRANNSTPNEANDGINSSPIEARDGFNSSPIEARDGFNSSPIEARDGFNSSPIEAINGFNSSPIEANDGFNSSPIEARDGFNSSPIEANDGFNSSPIEAIDGFNSSPIEANDGFNSSPIEAIDGFNYTPIEANDGFGSSPKSGTSPVSSKIQQCFQNLDYDKKYGFSEDIDSITIPKGLSENTIRLISELKEEPDWMLDFRLKAYAKFLTLQEPKCSDNRYPSINFRDMCYYSAPKKKPVLNSLDEVDPKLVEYFSKLGLPLTEQKRLTNVAVNAVFDSVLVAMTHRKMLEKAGVIFCSFSEAIIEYPDLIKKYLGRIVPSDDNYYAALNSAVFSDGSFCYIPKNTRCPMPLSTYFRINAMETGQFERTLIVAEEESSVEYLEGCTAPSYDTNQLRAAVVELYCGERATINYSTVQNWYAGDEQGKGGIYNFVTKRGLCAGDHSRISWTQVETGSAITWKYPSIVLEGDDSVGEFYSVAVTHNYQQEDTGTKMIHKGKNTKSRIISKGISAGHSRNCYRGLAQVLSKAEKAKYSSTCDSLLIGDKAAANTYPYIQNPSWRVEHEASTSKIGVDQIFYFQQRGIDQKNALAAMICGFCKDVIKELPQEFGTEVKELLNIKLEGSVSYTKNNK